MVAGFKTDEGKTAWGKIDYEQSTISIEARLSNFHRLEALLHEAIHGVADQMSVELPEESVGALGYGLTELLLDNPEFIALFSAEAATRADRRQKSPEA